jgi:hypothetical protein
MMIPRRLVPIIWLLTTALCWLGLIYLIYSTRPEGVNRWLFFVAFFASIMTSSFAPAYYLNLRFGWEYPQRVRLVRSLRESVLAGLYLSLCAWLQTIRVLNWTNALVILGILALLESFLLIRG